MSVVTVTQALKDAATPGLLKAAHAAKDLAGQNRAIADLQGELARVGREAERIRIGAEQFQIKEAIADLDRLEAKLRATGSATTEGLAGISERRAQLTAKSADLASKSVGNLSKRAKGLSDVAGDADSAVVGFSSVLDLVNPKLGASVRVIADVGASLEGLIRLAMVGAPILLALGAAAAVGGVAYSKWSAKVRRHKADVARNNAILEEARQHVLRMRDAGNEYLVSLGKLSKAERDIARLRRDSFVSTLPQLQETTKRIIENSQAVNKARSGWESYKSRVKEAESELSELQGILDSGAKLDNEQRRKQISLTNRLEALEGSRANAAERYSTALAEQTALNAERSGILGRAKQELDILILDTETREENARAEEARSRSVELTNSALQEQLRILDTLSSQVGSLLPAAALTDIERLGLARERLSQLEQELGRVGDQLADIDRARFESTIDEFRASLQLAVDDFVGDPIEIEIQPRIDTEEWVEQLRIAEQQRVRMERIDTATGAIGAVSGAMAAPGSALAGAGPVGALLGSIVGLLQQIGERTDSGRLAIEQRGDQFIQGLKAGLKALPEALGRSAPRFAAALVTQLIPALLESAVRLVSDFPAMLSRSISTALFEMIPRMIRQLGRMLQDLWARLMGGSGLLSRDDRARITGWSPIGGFRVDTGQESARMEATRETATGRARSLSLPNPIGRALRRAQPRSSQPNPNIQGSPGVTVNISGSLVDRNVVDRLGRELNRQFGSYGRATQPVFQGG